MSLRDIQSHLLKVIPGLSERGISRDAIHTLMVPPKLNGSRAHRYKKLIDAKVSGKRNDYREDSLNQHFLFARIKYREEFVAKFREEAEFYSADDMNKIRMGPSTAVSQYHQQRRFFIGEDTPNLNDHDFPNPGYLINCSGYLKLSLKPSCTGEREVDDDWEPNDHQIISNSNRDKLGKIYINDLVLLLLILVCKTI